MTSAILGVDIGTGSSKGVLVGTDGRVIASATRAHTVSRPAPGHVEIDAEVWWSEFVSLAEELCSGHDIVAIGVSGMGPCLLLTDDDGNALRPAILYGVDTRASVQIHRLTETYGAQAILDRCGSGLTSQAVGPKLAWVREHEPEVWARSRRLLMPSSYLAWRLTGAYILDRHSASQCTPLYDAAGRTWIPEWAAEIAPGIDLPSLCWPEEVVGTTDSPVAGIPAGIPVIAGSIDAWTESVSAGATSPGDLMLMYGTTMFLIATAEVAVTDPSMWGTTGVFPGTYNLAGGLATSGAITEWLRQIVGDVDYPTLLREAAESPVGARGLLVLPYFASERTPIQDPDARGVIIGLTVSHTRGDLYRAVLEGVALAVRHNIDTMRAAGATITRVVAVGGGTQGDLWTQIVSDATALSQSIPTVTIGASLGAAMLAGKAVLGAEALRWNPVDRIVAPNRAASRLYDERYELFRALYPATVSIMHRLADTTTT